MKRKASIFVQNRKFKMISIMRLLLLFNFTCVLSVTFAAGDAPQEITLDGYLFKSGTADPIAETNVNITVQILDSSSCLLYEEQYAGMDLNVTKGYFNIRVGSLPGSVKRSPSDPGNSMYQIFQNA